jgi:E3 ubiquitin-protein ligase DOA10
MAKLSTYTNNLFATHATMESAIEYAGNIAVACGTDNSAAVMTAVRVLLNTAISMHHAELAAANRPLIEMIDARVAAALENMQSDIENKITEAVDNYDFSNAIERGMENYPIDVETLLSGASVRINFD